MIDQKSPTHHIQKHIMGVLLYQKMAKFSQLRSPRTDTNLFSYHLKLLQREGFIQKVEGGYSLSSKGLVYVDRLTGSTMTVRHQPKIVTMLVVQNGDGQVLLQKRTKQPYIDTWTLPYGKMHMDDDSVIKAGGREANEKLALQNQAVSHVGDCYIRVRSDGVILSSTLAHVCRFETDEIQASETLLWVEPLNLSKYSLAPAVERIITRSFFGDDHFFDEFDIDWYN